MTIVTVMIVPKRENDLLMETFVNSHNHKTCLVIQNGHYIKKYRELFTLAIMLSILMSHIDMVLQILIHNEMLMFQFDIAYQKMP